MIGLYRFLETKDSLCKLITVLCNIFIAGIILYGIKIFFTEEKLFEPILYFIALFSVVLQIDLLISFKNKKNVHIDSFDYYMHIINPSDNKLMSIMDSFFKLTKKDNSERDWIEVTLVSMILITIVIGIEKLFFENFVAYFLFFILMMTINYIIFKILNKEKLYTDKLNLIANVSDLDKIEEIKYKIRECINAKGFINKGDILKIYKLYNKKQINYKNLFPEN